MEGINITTNRDMFRKIDKIRYIVRDIKDIFKDKSLKVNIRTKNEELGIEKVYNNCKIIGRIGTHHVICDITNKDIKCNDIVEFNINPKHVDSSIRRSYL